MRIIMLTTLVAVTAAMLLASSLAVLAQEDEQYASQEDGQYATEEQSDPTTEQPATTTIICAPWSKEWDVSEGQWVSDWYRWCVDSSVYDPAVESSWYKEWGSREYGGQVNLCPESGRCTVSPGGGVQMIRGN